MQRSSDTIFRSPLMATLVAMPAMPVATEGELQGRKFTYPSTGKVLEGFINNFAKAYLSSTVKSEGKDKSNSKEAFLENEESSFFDLSEHELEEMSAFLTSLYSSIKRETLIKEVVEGERVFLNELVQIIIQSPRCKKEDFYADARELCREKEFSQLFLDQALDVLIKQMPLFETLQLAYMKYQKDMIRAKAKAEEIHQILVKSRLEQNHSHIRVTNDPSCNQLTYTTLSQFKMATKLAKKYFRALEVLGSCQEDLLNYTRLVQIILCGQAHTDQFPLPNQLCCFYLSELEHVSSLKEDLAPLESRDSFAFREYRNFESQNPNESQEDYDKRRFHRIGEHFILDSMRRGAYTFERGEQIFVTRIKDFEAVSMLEVINLRYTDYLLKNPERVTEIIETQEKSNLFQLAKKLFARHLQLDKEEFPESILAAILAPYKDHADYVKHIELILKCSRMNPEHVLEISKKTGKSPAAIESLMRMKFLEIFILMNQHQQTRSTTLLHQGKLSDFPTPFLLNPASGVTFTFHADDFDSFTQTLRFQINTPFYSDGLHAYQVRGQVVKLAEVTSLYKIPSVCASDKGSPELTVFANPAFSCFTSSEEVDYMFAQIDPKAIRQEPMEAYKRFQVIAAQLNYVIKLPPGTYLNRKNGVFVGTAFSMLNRFNSNQVELKKLKQLTALVLESYELLQATLKQACEKELDLEINQKIIDDYRGLIESFFHQGLKSLTVTYTQKSAEIDAVLNSLKSVTDHILSKLV